MSALINTQAHRAARNAASIVLADSGAGNSTLRFYSTQGGTLRATRTLDKPCGAVRPADGRIALAQSATDLVASTGGVGWVEWCTGAGTPISAGHITDQNGDYTDDTNVVVPHPLGPGVFTLRGTIGTTVYEGGTVSLGTVLIG